MTWFIELTLVGGPSETEFFLHIEVLSEWLQEKLRLWKPKSKPTSAIGNKCLSFSPLAIPKRPL